MDEWGKHLTPIAGARQFKTKLFALSWLMILHHTTLGTSLECHHTHPAYSFSASMIRQMHAE
jgi:hypothetical protein